MQKNKAPQFRYAHDLCTIMAQQELHPYLVRYPLEPRLAILDVSDGGGQNVCVSLHHDNLKTELSAEVRNKIAKSRRRRHKRRCADLEPTEQKADRTRLKLWVRINNSLVFSAEEIELIDQTFGFEKFAPQTPESLAHLLKDSPLRIQDMRTQIEKVVRKLRSHEVWLQAQVPEAWRVRQGVTSVEPKVVARPAQVTDVLWAYTQYFEALPPSDQGFMSEFGVGMSRNDRWQRGLYAYLLVTHTQMNRADIADIVGISTASVSRWMREIEKWLRHPPFIFQLAELRALIRSVCTVR